MTIPELEEPTDFYNVRPEAIATEHDNFEKRHSVAIRLGNAAVALFDGTAAVWLAGGLGNNIQSVANGNIEDVIPAMIGGYVAYRMARGADRRGKAALRGTGDATDELALLSSAKTILPKKK